MQFGHIVPDPSTSGREPGVQDRGEFEGQGTATHQPPGEHVEGASGGDPVGGDPHETVQSGGSGGECQRSGGLPVFVEYRLNVGDGNDGAIATTIPVDEEAPRGFGALRGVLKAVYTNYKVRLWFAAHRFFLTNPPVGNRRHRKQG